MAAAAASAELNAVTICTAAGYKVITLPDDPALAGLPADERSDHADVDLDCMACLTQAVSKAGVAVDVGWAPVGRLVAAHPPIVEQEQARRSAYSPLQSRAPPLVKA
jgi:hypothetical protein